MPHPSAVVNVDIPDVAVETEEQNESPFAVTLQKYFVAGANDGGNVVRATSEAITRTGGDTLATRTPQRNAPDTAFHDRVGAVETPAALIAGAVRCGAAT